MSLKKIIYNLNLNLRKLILFLTVFSVFSLFIATLLVNYFIQKNQLIENSLSVNMEYAIKIANGTDSHLKAIMQELSYSAKQLETSFNDEHIRRSEVERLKGQSTSFNSVVIADYKGNVLNYAPHDFEINQYVINNTLDVHLSLDDKQPLIPLPHYSINNNLVIFLTQPVFDPHKKYLGFIGAMIYLKEDNIIHQLLTIKYGYKNSFMYVLDKSKTIIFHPSEERIGTPATAGSYLKFMAEHPSGKVIFTNHKGVKQLAGFAHVPTTDWIVVSQQPIHELLDQASAIIYKIILGMACFYIIIFLLVWRFSNAISRPLFDLANMAGHLNEPLMDQKIRTVNPWYFEVYKFRHSLLTSTRHFREKISELNFYVNTDPLTGFYNRRGMDTFVDEFVKSETPFSIIAIDIDHFKLVNDLYGHDKGDVVLEAIARHIQSNFREKDICCRAGGEEFIVLVPDLSEPMTRSVAERLRQHMETSVIDSVGYITISIGIAYCDPVLSPDVKSAFKLADKRLYLAKSAGRNRIR
ncbi:sensor domain-containing diguanylate cyclase [Acinetobacter sp. WZC-1]|uniref:sensor domain-containing diguanylate cyclase n=1 Tax=Acinetobacter sp. WZC-1 TaxID=3459034 RepID=UPI00403D93B4